MHDGALRRKTTLAALLALTVVLAGCGGGTGTPTATPAGQDGGTTPAATGSAADGATTPAATPTATPTLASATLGQRHNRSLRAAGSFTVDYVVRMETDDGTIETDRDVAVTFERGRGYTASNTTIYDPDGTPNATIGAETYVAGTTEYERTTLGEVGDPLVVEDTLAAPGGINATNVVAGNGTAAMRGGDVQFWVAGHQWRWRGSTTWNGATVDRYALAADDYGDVRLDEVLLGNGSVATDVTATDSRLLVEGGVVRLLELDLEWTNDAGSVATMTVRLRVTDVGSTTVAAPDWVASSS